MFKALHSDPITLHLITEENFDSVYATFSGFTDSDYMLSELENSYRPKYEEGQRISYGFYTTLGGELAGLTLLDVDNFKDRIGSTGADILMHMRGKGIAPLSKPHLFYLGFELLGLNRIESGCVLSNLASKRSIEKTPGFKLEGILRESALKEDGTFEDQYLYSILRREWEELYDRTKIQVIY